MRTVASPPKAGVAGSNPAGGAHPQVSGAGLIRTKIGRCLFHPTIGSPGAAHYLTANLADLFQQVGDVPFSLAVRCTYDGLTITGTELAAGPFVW